MAIKDLHLLPRVEDGWSFLYVQQCRIEQDGKSISVWEDTGRTAVPCAALSLLMLGPGTAITHAAVRTLAESGCMILRCGEEGVREVVPTRVGVNRLRAWTRKRTPSCPHARGGEPRYEGALREVMVLSPRAWG